MRVRGALQAGTPLTRLQRVVARLEETHAEGAYAAVSFVTFTSTVMPRKLEALPE